MASDTLGFLTDCLFVNRWFFQIEALSAATVVCRKMPVQYRDRSDLERHWTANGRADVLQRQVSRSSTTLCAQKARRLAGVEGQVVHSRTAHSVPGMGLNRFVLDLP